MVVLLPLASARGGMRATVAEATAPEVAEGQAVVDEGPPAPVLPADVVEGPEAAAELDEVAFGTGIE